MPLLPSTTFKRVVACAAVAYIGNLCTPRTAIAEKFYEIDGRGRSYSERIDPVASVELCKPLSDTTQSASTSDLDWAVIEALMKSVKMPRGAEKSVLDGPNGDRYWIWREASRRLLYDLGLEFYDKYPNDARRWTWLATVMPEGLEPYYFENYGNLTARAMGGPRLPVNTLVRERWKQRKPTLVAELLASPQATSVQKSAVIFADFYSRARRATFRFPKEMSEEGRNAVWKLGEEFLALAAKYPKEDSDWVRNSANALLGFARGAGAQGDSLIARLRVSPNGIVRTYVNADLVFEKAARTPMTMSFTALDGRKVDLAKLRGKVVLIDFTAYTWCGACREAEPHVKAAYEKYHDKGLEIIGFALEFDPTDRVAVIRYLSSHNIKWPHYFDGKGMENEYVTKFGFNGVPQMLLLDKNGLLVGRSGGNKGMSTILPLIEKALGVEADGAKMSAKTGTTNSL